jgi:ADP-ribosylglycohydrolase
MIIPGKDKFSGCLIGQCLGDALGFPVEGYPPQVCQHYVDDFLRANRAGERGRGPFPFGQYTDDSQLARELMQSYAACKKFDAADYADHIASIFRENRIVGRGRATELAAQNLMSGIPWDKAGTPPPSAGNGSAMRAGPIGLLFFDEPENLIQAAREQGLITHQDIRCSAGAVAIAGAVALSLLMDGIESNAFIKQLQDWTAVIDRSFADSVVRLTDWIKLPPETATQFIGKEGLSQSSLDNWHGISPFVTGSVLWSLYSFLRSTDDYWETICTGKLSVQQSLLVVMLIQRLQWQGQSAEPVSDLTQSLHTLQPGCRIRAHGAMKNSSIWQINVMRSK